MNDTRSNPHVLLIDDNRDGLLARRMILEDLGFWVQTADSGEEGLKLFEGSSFDVVVTDFKMPRMNGDEVIRRMREKNPAARVILLSGFVEPLGLTEQNTGADVVLIKGANEAAHLQRWVKRLVNLAARKPPVSQGRPQISRLSGR